MPLLNIINRRSNIDFLRLFINFTFIIIVVLYTSLLKLSVGLPLRTLLLVFLVLVLFVTHRNLMIGILRLHHFTVFLFLAVGALGAVIALSNGRSLAGVVDGLLSIVIQPFLIFLASYALCVISGFRFVAFVFLASALFTGFIAILQFLGFGPAWRLYDILGEIQSLPAQFQLREDINRPKGVSLTPVIFSYHIVTAYLLSNLLYRKGQISPTWYGILFFAFMCMAAANGTRSALLGIAAHEALFAFLAFRVRSYLWLGFLGIVGFAGLAYLELKGSRVASIDDASAAGRIVLYKYGWLLATDHPLGLGWGYDKGEMAWRYWEHLAGQINPDAVFRLNTHNAFLNFFHSYGILGLLLISIVFISRMKYSIIIFFSSIGYMIHAFFHNNGVFLGEYYYFFFLAILLYFIKYDELAVVQNRDL